MNITEARALIRDVADFPKPGVVFKDISPLLGDAAGLRAIVDALAAGAAALRPELILGVESRGFLLGAPVARALNLGLGLVRKPGKLPCATVREEYALEYGTDTLELHIDAVRLGQRVLIVDDVLATGGTAAATGRLVERAGGVVAGFAFLIELEFLHGRDRLGRRDVVSLFRY